MLHAKREAWTVDALLKRISGRTHESPGRLCLGPNGRHQKSVRSQAVVRAETDTTAMTATACICTPVVDREGEVILPDGIRLDNYKNNPIVLWEHGDGQIDFPIASSEDPNSGELQISLDEDEAIGTSHFYAKSVSPESYQLFGLIDAGAVRSTSIQSIPLEVAQYHDGEGNTVPVTESCDLIEWSWTCIGVNPTALKKSWRGTSRERDSILSAIELQNEAACRVLQAGSLGMDRLLPVVRKSLKPLTGRTQTLGVGATFRQRKSERSMKELLAVSEEELNEMDESQKKSLQENIDDYDEDSQSRIKKAMGGGSDLDDDEVEIVKSIKKSIQDELEMMDDDDDAEDLIKKAMDGEIETLDPESQDRIKKALNNDLDEFDEESAAIIKKAVGGDEEDPMDDVDPDALEPDEEVDPTQQKAMNGGRVKPGALFLQGVYDGLSVLTDYAGEELLALENVAVKEGMLEELEQIQSSIATLKGIYAQEYPELPPLGEKAEGSAVAETEVETQMKSMFATSKRGGFQAKGIEARIRQLRQVKGLPKKTQDVLTDTARDLARLQRQAKSYTAPVQTKGMVSAAKHQRLEKQLEKANATIEKFLKQAESMKRS